MDQTAIIQYIMGFVMFLLGIMVNATRQSIKDLQTQDQALATKVQAIEVLVAGNYVHKDDLEKTTDALFRKLDQICDKLDRKADR